MDQIPYDIIFIIVDYAIYDTGYLNVKLLFDLMNINKIIENHIIKFIIPKQNYCVNSYFYKYSIFQKKLISKYISLIYKKIGKYYEKNILDLEPEIYINRLSCDKKLLVESNFLSKKIIFENILYFYKNTTADIPCQIYKECLRCSNKDFLKLSKKRFKCCCHYVDYAYCSRWGYYDKSANDPKNCYYYSLIDHIKDSDSYQYFLSNNIYYFRKFLESNRHIKNNLLYEEMTKFLLNDENKMSSSFYNFFVKSMLEKLIGNKGDKIYLSYIIQLSEKYKIKFSKAMKNRTIIINDLDFLKKIRMISYFDIIVNDLIYTMIHNCFNIINFIIKNIKIVNKNNFNISVDLMEIFTSKLDDFYKGEKNNNIYDIYYFLLNNSNLEKDCSLKLFYYLIKYEYIDLIEIMIDKELIRYDIDFLNKCLGFRNSSMTLYFINKVYCDPHLQENIINNLEEIIPTIKNCPEEHVLMIRDFVKNVLKNKNSKAYNINYSNKIIYEVIKWLNEFEIFDEINEFLIQNGNFIFLPNLPDKYKKNNLFWWIFNKFY